ncbi:MAG: hypothetical protein NW237_16500 [Cyanobacteriota bacterium]|nr:hypothetical protein [Cyanobacteriota bacterium]
MSKSARRWLPIATVPTILLGLVTGCGGFNRSYDVIIGGNFLSGIEGQVLLESECLAGSSPCPSQPYQARVDVLDGNRNVVTSFRSAPSSGEFEVQLSPGTYTLAPNAEGVITAPEQTVDVTFNQFAVVTIVYQKTP